MARNPFLFLCHWHQDCYTEHCAACPLLGGEGQYWNSIGSNPCVCWEIHTGVCLHPPLPSIIFLPADQDTFSKTAGQSQAYYNTWNWEWGELWRHVSANFNMRSSSGYGGQCTGLHASQMWDIRISCTNIVFFHFVSPLSESDVSEYI